MTGFLMLAVMIGLTLIGLPIAIALALSAMGTLYVMGGWSDLSSTAMTMYSGTTSFPLLAIPIFILAGGIMNQTSISRRLIDFASSLVGFVRGGLGMVNVTTSLFFAEISGSAVADVAATGSILVPAMKRKGYSAAFAAAVTSSSASLAIIIPPSIPMILYAVMANTSVVQMFVAGVVPGLLGGGLMMLVCYLHARRNKMGTDGIFAWGELGRAFREASWSLLLPVIVLGGIFGGIVTATEGAAIAVLTALLVAGILYRELTLRGLAAAFIEAAQHTAIVMLLVAASALVGTVLTELRYPQQLASAILEITQNPILVLAMLNVLLLILGLFLHSSAAIVLVVPIVMPIVTAVGIDPVHFGIVVTLNMAISQQTPPVASVLITACSVARENVWNVARANVPFVILLLGLLLLVTYVPFVSLGLVEYFYR
ncbi:TRAP transporter large permease [Sulfitobacter sp. W002]|uniref:TRAP transporter large permease n=1 Tax=Sulfitobacter sp. W002 TaxID=2867024 RepID=UPI0021A5E6EA|nr:TRAP transporter large permease [Sulfitobacter sp. W002]UWR30940.1 TRAP transporter large permease [Sulfitobacter sp. W002]